VVVELEIVVEVDLDKLQQYVFPYHTAVTRGGGGGGSTGRLAADR